MPPLTRCALADTATMRTTALYRTDRLSFDTLRARPGTAAAGRERSRATAPAAPLSERFPVPEFQWRPSRAHRGAFAPER